MVGRWMARAPPTPKITRPPHTPPRTHQTTKASKNVSTKEAKPGGLKMHNEASRGGMLLYRRGAA